VRNTFILADTITDHSAIADNPAVKTGYRLKRARNITEHLEKNFKTIPFY